MRRLGILDSSLFIFKIYITQDINHQVYFLLSSGKRLLFLRNGNLKISSNLENYFKIIQVQRPLFISGDSSSGIDRIRNLPTVEGILGKRNDSVFQIYISLRFRDVREVLPPDDTSDLYFWWSILQSEMQARLHCFVEDFHP